MKDIQSVKAKEAWVRVSTAFQQLKIACDVDLKFFEESRGAIDDLRLAMKALGREHPDIAYLADLSLYGDLRPTRDTVDPKFAGDAKVLVVAPQQAELLAHLYPERTVLSFRNLREVLDFSDHFVPVVAPAFVPVQQEFDPLPPELKDLFAVASAALAEGKNVVFSIDRPGRGATMLARRLVNALGLLSYEQAKEVSRVHAITGITSELVRSRPFRAPHHTCSDKGLAGETQLAKHGVLFLDEAHEFRKSQVTELFREQQRQGNSFRLVLAWCTKYAPEPSSEKVAEWNAVLIRIGD